MASGVHHTTSIAGSPTRDLGSAARAGELADFVGEAPRLRPRPALRNRLFERREHRRGGLLLHPKTLKGAILMRAMAPLTEPSSPDLSASRVLILSGLNDPIASRSTAEKLAAALLAAGANAMTCRRPMG